MKKISLIYLLVVSLFSFGQNKESIDKAINETFFIENKGQWDSDVLFLCQIKNMNFWITKKVCILIFMKSEWILLQKVILIITS
jgi:hypothetical protein